MYCENCGKKINDNDQFCTDCGKKIELESEVVPENHEGLKENIPKKRKLRIVLLVILSLFFISGIIFVYSKWVSIQTKTSVESEETSMVDNTAAVVNIFCDTDYGGTGTIMSKEGIIVTNEHVLSGATMCVVTLPNPVTGEIVELYKAEPIIFPKLSEQYDIAFLEIYDVVVDDDGEELGTFPAILPYLQFSDNCQYYQYKLGESIKIYGYPITSNNYNLTVTEGIISNFDDDGYILTSAKIDSGNSGGLVLNQEGCVVGIPTAIREGDYQNLGVIIPFDYVYGLLEEAVAQEENSTL